MLLLPLYNRMLVSHGAHAMATRCRLDIVGPETMATDRAIEEWEKWRSRLDKFSSNAMQDTVGALCWDRNGIMAAGVSR